MIELGTIQRRRGVSYYHQLYLLLAMALDRGLIGPGGLLPSESALMREFAVSRNTVRRSLRQLELEKRIVRRRGSGSFARQQPTPGTSPDVIVEALHCPKTAKDRTTSRLLKIQLSATPTFIRSRDPDFGDRCVVVRRCRSFQKEPFMLSISHVPEHLLRHLKRRQLDRVAVLAILEAIGARPAYAEQTTTAVGADVLAAQTLDVEPKSALLCVHRLVRDRDGRSIEHQTSLYRPDRFHLRTRVDIEHSPRGLSWANADSTALMPAWL
jgi:GntR family transcriptional regulator